MCFWHRPSLLMCRAFYLRRNLYIRSRFQPLFHSKETSKNSPQINSQTFTNPRSHVHSSGFIEPTSLNVLEDSIINKISCLKLSKLADDNDDLKLIRDIETVRPKLTDIDAFILRISKMMVESSTHRLDYIKTINTIESKFFKNGKPYKYKYPLLSDKATLTEVTTLKDLVRRLTKDNFINNNENIKSFIVNRIMKCRDTNILLQQDRELTYILLHYFLRKYKPSNLAFIEKLLNNVDQYDTRLLNLIMNYSFKNASSQYDKLKIINKMLSTFNYYGVNLNRTSIYIIFKHLIFGKNISNMKLHRFLMKYMKNEQIIDNKYITSLLYEKLLKLYILLNETKDSNIRNAVTEEIKNLFSIFPKFNKVEPNEVSLSCIRKLFSTSKFNDEVSFRRIFQLHLYENKWRFVWDSISTYRLLQTNALPNFSKNKLLRKFPSLKYSNFGQSFKKGFHFLGSLWASELCYYAIKTHNWELLIRVVNEFNDLKYLVFKKAFTALLELDVTESRLDYNEYLIIVKFLLHSSLKNRLGAFTRNDSVFKKLQEKIDSLYGTSFSPQNYTAWQQNIEVAKLEFEKNSSSKFQLFDHYFIKNEDYVSTFIIEEDMETPSPNDFSSLITPDLSRVTSFEKRLLEKLSNLKILDTEEKTMMEYNNYSEFWDSKGIRMEDVKNNYFLGVADCSYKNEDIQWKPIDTNYDRDRIIPKDFEFKNNKMYEQINNFLDEELIVLLKGNPKYEIVLNLGNETRILNPSSSLNNVLPTDWLQFPFQQTHREWIEDSIVKGTNRERSLDGTSS